mgnify:CR=1 FL=1
MTYLEKQIETNPKLNFNVVTSPNSVGIRPEGQKQVVHQLQGILSNMFSLYQLALGCHWNVRGIHFDNFHRLFEGHYKSLLNGADEIAERIRMLDGEAPYTPKDLALHSEVEVKGLLKNEKDMLIALREGNEVLARKVHAAIQVCKKSEDEVTADILIKRLFRLEEAVWYAKNLLQGSGH